MGKQRTFTKEFKESAMKLYHDSGKTRAEVAEVLGINPESLCRWLRESEKGKSNKLKVFPGRGNPRDKELTQLRKEVAGLRETNKMLEKVITLQRWPRF